jgi:hypothetical protein
MLNLKRDKNFFGKFRAGKPEGVTHDAVTKLVSLLTKKPDISDTELEQWANWFHMPLDLVKQLRRIFSCLRSKMNCNPCWFHCWSVGHANHRWAR